MKPGDIIAEIETDKATMEVEAVDEGKVSKLLVAEGTEGVKVNTPIATLLLEGETAGDAAAKEPAAAVASAPPRPAPAKSGTPATGGSGQTRRRCVQAGGFPRRPRPTREGGGGRGRDEPRTYCRGRSANLCVAVGARLAKELGLDVANLNGSGPRGRVVRRDVEAALQQRGAQPKAGTAVAQMPATGAAALQPMGDDKILALYDQGAYEIVPHDGMRRIIAQRLSLSKQTIRTSISPSNVASTSCCARARA